MKKFCIFALILVLTLSMCACGRSGTTPGVPSTTPVAPQPTVPEKPIPDPTTATNIPDPEVNSNSTMPGGITTDPNTNDLPGDITDNMTTDPGSIPNQDSNIARSRMRGRQ